MRSFSIQSFGCRTNQAEAFQWAGQFQQSGLVLENDFYKSDIVIVNTCTLTQRADADARNFIRKVSRKNPKARIIVTGCYAEREPVRFRKNSKVWKVFLNNEKDLLQQEVIEDFGNSKPVPYSPFRSRAPVKIQEGCDFNCTFCIIPEVRGPSRSRHQDEIINRAKELAAKGFKEIVLTGIHICLYGRDLKPKSSLEELVSGLVSVKGLECIRLSSLDPRFLNKNFIDFMTSQDKICPHFHFSLQHTSDRIIRRMGRKINSEKYRNILKYTREKSPDASMGADIIVGFPGESNQDFDQLYTFLEKSPLSYFHVFSYSPRPGTPAAEQKRVHSKTEKKRSAVLRELSQKKNLKFRQRFENKILDAVVIKEKGNKLHVLTPNYLKVVIPDGSYPKRSRVKVKITEVGPKETRGIIVL
ncbi:MAG TPA: tRNA (N(6)-L-threonylcarbamoyladenosine(37)-C(2))-methylthiotransferase MtaB [Acidobacteriota bacterium]|nr:tRNA (N(6)-L-threonylcarbamoyladenosine(37)-C(2))-methylthiotransferase MtaB [Acidobacteriota bacterium]